MDLNGRDEHRENADKPNGIRQNLEFFVISGAETMAAGTGITIAIHTLNDAHQRAVSPEHIHGSEGRFLRMLPVIEVQCPFCNASGQIMAPPLGSVVVGPCPRCGEIVLLYDGTVLPLEKDIIIDGTDEEKKQHLLETILEMVASKVDEVIENNELGAESKQQSHTKKGSGGTKKIKPSVRNKKAPPIGREDVRDFVDIDLHLLDSKHYFDKVFKKRRTER